VGNFEGVLADPRAPQVFMGQRHGLEVFDFLAALAPTAQVLPGVANNHAADYGRAQLTHSCRLLNSRGIQVFGLADQPAVLVSGAVLIAAGTEWSNRPAGYVARLEQLGGLGPGSFRILYPHWGYEMQAYPHPRQVAACGRELAGWHMIVGHHSHWPQPVTLHETEGRRRVVAYSLGNFTFGLRLAKHQRGTVLVVRLGPGADGRWTAGGIQWQQVAIRFFRGGRAEVELADPPAG